MNAQTTLSLLLFFVTSLVAAQDADSIRWNLKPGDKLQATLEQTTQVETNVDTRRKEIGNDMLLVIDWQIDKVVNDTIEMTQSINRIKLEIRRPSKTATETTTVDTESTDEPNPGLASQLDAQVASLIGTKFNVVMTTRGEIAAVTIPEASKAAIRQAPASMMLREILTQDGLKEILGQSAIVFPETLDNKRWTISSEAANSIGKIRKDTVIQYEGTTDRNDSSAHTFKMTSSAETLEDAQAEDAPKMDDFSGSGNAWYSPDAKLVYENNFENQMNVTRRYRDQKIVSSVSTTTKMQVVKK